MQAPYNEKWERTKRHLMRNFLVNPAFQLSPIPEEERSSPDSSGSLPDLIVEPEPDRHDHPPSFYEGLERRMKRYHRQLFLGVNDSEDDSSDFEVNRSMASTFMLDIDTRKDNVIRNDTNIDSDLGVPITKENQLTKSTTESDDYLKEREETFSDKLIDTCARYNVTSRISIDDSNKSTTEDEDEHLQSIESPTKSNETETELSEDIEVNDNKQIGNDKSMNLTNEATFESLVDYNINRRLYRITEEEAEITETKSVSDDSIEQCHRISTTIAEVHEPPVRGSVQFNNGSPVLIPRALQFGRTVFGSGIVSRLSGQSINILETSGENINRVPTHIAEQSNKQDITIVEPETDVQRLLTASEVTLISIDVETLNTEVVNITRTDHNQEDAVESHEIHTGHNLQESDLDGDDIQNASIDWSKNGIDVDEDSIEFAIGKGVFASKARKFVFYSSDDDSFENLEPIAHGEKSIEEMREARGSGGGNVSWHGEIDQTSPTLAFEAKISADKLEHVSSNSNEINTSINEEIVTSVEEHDIQNPHNYLRIIDDVRSVSPVEVNHEDLLKDNSRSNKRKSDSSDDAPSSKRKKDVSIQTSSNEKLQVENVRIVGSPLVFTLCRCPDHVCP